MSHSPESHQERPEPERIPFVGDPGEDLYTYHKVGNALDGYSWITTHQGPSGNFYTIKNAGIPEASMSIYNEKKRNAKLADAFTNGLYRYRENGSVFRPAPSDKNLPFIEATGLGEHEYGVSDKFKNKDLMDSETLNRIGSNGFMSTGRGPMITDTDGNTHHPNNQKGEIDKRSASIVLSYEARDKAMSEGKTPEEAQEIGAEEYRRQEDFRVLNNESSDNREPNQTIIEPTGENKPSDGEKLEEIVVEDNPEENERNEHRSEAMKKFFRKIGVNTLSGVKIVRKVGVPLLTHAGQHKALDAVDGSLEKFDTTDDALSEKARESIDAFPLVAGLAIEKASEELLMKIDLALDKMTELGENAIDKTKQTAAEIAKHLADTFKKAIEMLGEKRDQLIKYWQERYEQVMNKLRAFVKKRQESWQAFNGEADSKASEFVNKLIKYMLTKHRNDLRYYDKTTI